MVQENVHPHLVFVPSIGLSHIIPTVELAKRLLKHNPHFTITFFIIPDADRSPAEYISNSIPPPIRFILLPPAELPPLTAEPEPGFAFLSFYIQNHLPFVKQHLSQLINESPSPNSVRVIFDMFSSTVVDVAKELSIPSYLYFTSSASNLGFFLHFPTLDAAVKLEFLDHASELSIPSYINPVPTLSLPSFCLNRKSDNYRWFLKHSKNCRSCDGIIVNSVSDLELCSRNAFDRMAGTIPRVYYPGPILKLDGNTHTSFGLSKAQSDKIISWLDEQPVASVVLLSFGTRGSLSVLQLKEIAYGLERSGQRFIWSIRCPPTVKDAMVGDYSNLDDVLPNGFVDRVRDRGMVCGWVPQVQVLGHKAVGGFVTHCGWSSILESVWFGVPMLTWPLDAEQKLNAFEVVVDLRIAVELKKEGVEVVEAKEVESSVRDIIECCSGVRMNMKKMSEKCHVGVIEGGTSLNSLECLIKDLKVIQDRRQVEHKGIRGERKIMGPNLDENQTTMMAMAWGCETV